MIADVIGTLVSIGPIVPVESIKFNKMARKKDILIRESRYDWLRLFIMIHVLWTKLH